jgi:subtilisin family serine protease
MRDRVLGAALAGTLLLVLGCASAPSLSGGGAPGASDRQVMVTYAKALPQIWNANTVALEQRYRLGLVYAWTMESLGEQCVVFEVPPGSSAHDVAQQLAKDPRVSIAQTVEIFRTQGGGDPYAHLQHGSTSLRLEQAHRWATGKGVKVAVVDTGIDFDHPDLRERVKKAQNFVDRGERSFTSDIHGTAVAGLIAATANNDIGIAGAAPQAEIYALKACWEQPPGVRQAICTSYTLAKAVDFAIVQGAQVLNFSLAGPADPLLGKLIDHALAKGIVVVAADGGTAAQDFPASYKGVIGVMGSDDLQGPPTVPPGHSPATLAAPGVDILTTMPHGAYDLFSGSSAAAAEISGIAALLLEKNPRLTPPEIAAILHKTSHPIAADPVGEVDACAAVASLSGEGCP